MALTEIGTPQAASRPPTPISVSCTHCAMRHALRYARRWSERGRRLASGGSGSRLLLLRGGRAGPGRQLQHRGALVLAQTREQHHLPVRKFERVVMGHGIIGVDLPEAGKALTDLLIRQDTDAEGRLAFYILVKSELGAGQQAHRDVRLADRRKTAGDGVGELRRYQLVLKLGRTGRDMVQTIVAH